MGLVDKKHNTFRQVTYSYYQLQMLVSFHSFRKGATDFYLLEDLLSAALASAEYLIPLSVIRWKKPLNDLWLLDQLSHCSHSENSQ